MTPTIRFRTKSGSMYEVCGNRIRRVERSAVSVAERVASEWRTAQSISAPKIGESVEIVWGTGRDRYSPEGAPDDERNTRATITSRVVEIT